MYYVRNTNERLGEYREVECEDEVDAQELADEFMEDLWVMNRDFCDFWDINELVEDIRNAVEIEEMDEEQ